jgi:hypothetical protein
MELLTALAVLVKAIAALVGVLALAGAADCKGIGRACRPLPMRP